jgi:HSP20 family molecular chaperone IbpA
VEVIMSAPKLAFGSRPASSAIPSFLVGPEADAMEQALSRKITERARQIFEQSGSISGNDEGNWLQAESETLHPRLEVRECGTWMTLNAWIPNTSGQELEIAIQPMRVIVRASQTDEPNASELTAHASGDIFLAANLALEVEPSSAAASFRGHNLHLMIRKSRPDRLTPSFDSASK